LKIFYPAKVEKVEKGSVKTRLEAGTYSTFSTLRFIFSLLFSFFAAMQDCDEAKDARKSGGGCGGENGGGPFGTPHGARGIAC
jgi:hypothetical protein